SVWPLAALVSCFSVNTMGACSLVVQAVQSHSNIPPPYFPVNPAIALIIFSTDCMTAQKYVPEVAVRYEFLTCSCRILPDHSSNFLRDTFYQRCDLQSFHITQFQFESPVTQLNFPK